MITIHNTREEIAAAKPAIAIVPFANVQQHGPHLPLETDAIILDAVSRGIAERSREEVYLLPPMPAGVCTRHLGFGGTVSLRNETMHALVKDIIWSVRWHGTRKILLLNGIGVIGGHSALPNVNMALKTAVRDMNCMDLEADRIWLQPAVAAQTALKEIFPDWKDEVIGGDFETSCMLHLHPELVRGTVANYIPEVPNPAMLEALPFRTISPSGVWGRPEQAAAEKGQRAVEAMIAGSLAYMERTFAYLGTIKNRKRSVLPQYP